MNFFHRRKSQVENLQLIVSESFAQSARCKSLETADKQLALESWRSLHTSICFKLDFVNRTFESYGPQYTKTDEEFSLEKSLNELNKTVIQEINTLQKDLKPTIRVAPSTNVVGYIHSQSGPASTFNHESSIALPITTHSTRLTTSSSQEYHIMPSKGDYRQVQTPTLRNGQIPFHPPPKKGLLRTLRSHPSKHDSKSESSSLNPKNASKAATLAWDATPKTEISSVRNSFGQSFNSRSQTRRISDISYKNPPIGFQKPKQTTSVERRKPLKTTIYTYETPSFKVETPKSTSSTTEILSSQPKSTPISNISKIDPTSAGSNLKKQSARKHLLKSSSTIDTITKNKTQLDPIIYQLYDPNISEITLKDTETISPSPNSNSNSSSSTNFDSDTNNRNPASYKTGEEKQEQIISSIKGIDKEAAKKILNEIIVNGDKVNWSDIAGLDQAKIFLKETVVYPFLRPDLFNGLREPARGMLLFGPPGTGKTMLAKAVATESKSTFFSISASSLTSKFLGESEKLVRALFKLAKYLSPSIIFIDEIDSLLSSRNDTNEAESSRRIKTELLIQWSNLSRSAAGRNNADNEGDAGRVLVLAATNTPWAIDEAARRRFVRRQYIPLPEDETRKIHFLKLLEYQHHSLNQHDIDELIDLTKGYSGSDITALAKDAAMGPLRALGDDLLLTKREDIRAININDFRKSLQYIRPSVSQEGLEKYEDWASQYGSSGA